ncbi:DUF2280 domain-containing protein [Stenotrophomonas sp. AR029]|uniref:DUF2280 domain-containing protein n=1 Tax=Stenotrophomonas sp. AR029 TaxID=3398601 RepID=UPI0039C74164
MAALSSDIKAFIVQSLACFDTPSQVVEAVKAQYGVEISRQQAETHDPTKFAGRDLGAKWVTLFHESRARFKEETVNIPIANRAFRLRALDRMTAASTTRSRSWRPARQPMTEPSGWGSTCSSCSAARGRPCLA